MRPKTFAVAALLAFSCQKKPVVKPASDSGKAEIVKRFNQVKSLEGAVDTAAAGKLERLAANQPAPYKAMADIACGIASASSASYELARKYYETALRQASQPAADTLRAFALTGIGNSYKNTGDYPKAFDAFYKALKIFENRKHADGISTVNSYIGETHIQKGDFPAARENLTIALKTLEHDKGRGGYLNALHSLANVYGMAEQYDKALSIDAEGLRISDSIHSPKSKVMFLDNKANCYLFSNQVDSAEFYFRKCLALDKANGNINQVADTYSNLGNLASFRGDWKTAEAMTRKSIAIFDSIGNKFNLSKSYQILTDIYARKGDYKKALEANRTFFEQYRKMVSEKKEASLAEFRILHETDRKEKELAEKRLQLIEAGAEVRQRNYLLIVLLLAGFFVTLTGALLYRQQRLRNRQQGQEHELKTAIARIETQNKLQDQRLAISRDLHDNIGAQLTFIISSVDNIKYAFDMGNTALDRKLQNISVFARETIVELRDTIWAMNNSEIGFEDLRTRIFNFIEKAKESARGVHFEFNVSDALAGMRFSSVVAMNIHRTVQEAINNALKHATATDAVINIAPEANNILITIDDNGKGFDPETAEKGNGLQNMQKRIADIGGTFGIITKPGGGTHIHIVLPPDFGQSKPA